MATEAVVPSVGTGTGAEADAAMNPGEEDVSKGAPNWCLVKAKTRQHNSTRVAKKMIWFEAKPGAVFKIGSAKKDDKKTATDNDLKLDDDRCKELNAQLRTAMVDGKAAGIALEPMERMYRLIGSGSKRNMGPAEIGIGSVIKVGSVSLEVIDLSTDESEDFVERFRVEIDESKASRHVHRHGPSKRHEDSVALESDGSNELPGEEDDEAGASDDIRSEEDAEKDDDLDKMCYICWGDADADLVEDQEEDDTLPSRVAEPLGRENPLIRNPCGRCVGSSQYVHLNCLLQWITSSGSGNCSICGTALPSHFSSPPPSLELKVIRHRRNAPWSGVRRFRISFAERGFAVIGRDSSADVRLGDRSVGAQHAKISFDRDTRQFFVSDMNSLGGTFLQLKDPLSLEPEESVYAKIGRTLITLRATHRRGTLFMPSGFWKKR